MPPELLLIDAREAARLLSISDRTLWTMTNRGEIPCVRIGRSVRYSPDDIRAWIESAKTFKPSSQLSPSNADGPPSS